MRKMYSRSRGGIAMATSTTHKVRRDIQSTKGNEKLKSISWKFEKESYVILNVPFKSYDEYSDEQVYDSEVSVKLLLLKELMEAKEIPAKIDFQRNIK